MYHLISSHPRPSPRNNSDFFKKSHSSTNLRIYNQVTRRHISILVPVLVVLHFIRLLYLELCCPSILFRNNWFQWRAYCGVLLTHLLLDFPPTYPSFCLFKLSVHCIQWSIGKYQVLSAAQQVCIYEAYLIYYSATFNRLMSLLTILAGRKGETLI